MQIKPRPISSPKTEPSLVLFRRRRMARSRWRAAAALASALVVSTVTPLTAHETGVVRLNASQLPIGGALVVRGAQMGKGASYRVELRGTLKTFSFGRVRADTAGRFELSVTLPAEAGAGTYTVAAVAADGDVSAQADLAILPGGATEAMSGHQMAGMAGMAGMAHATAEPMNVPRTTTPAGWAVVALIIALSAVAGILLLRRGDDSAELRG